MDQGELAGHGVAGAAVIARRGLQVGVIVQTDFARADAQQAQQDPEHQQRNVKQLPLQQTLNDKHDRRRRDRHQ